MNVPYLSIIVFLPVVGAIVLALMPRPSGKTVKLTAALFTLASLVLSLVLFLGFDRTVPVGGAITPQFEELLSWIPAIDVNYHLGVDGISLPMVGLTTFLGFLSVLVSWKVALRVKEYFIWLLMLETGILGVFVSLDLVLFFLFWEVELIPMYMLISTWGTGRKEYSAIKFVIYTLVGSALMLVGILSLYFLTGSFDMTRLSMAGVSPASISIFLLIFAAFAIKLPMFPFHTWLPDAHTDAPTAVSVILAGVLLKMGGYGIIRISVSLFPDVAHRLAPLLVILAVVGTVYGALITVRQTDLKRMIAYSSVSHMGYVLLGIFALSQVSLVGATLQMFSHGVVTGLLFAMVGLVYEKTHQRSIPKLGGLARQMPIIVVVFSIAGLASLGLPGTSGFIAEFLVFLGSFSSAAFEGIRLYVIIGVGAIVVTAGYILWMLQRVFYGPPLETYDHAGDADALERVTIFSLVAAIMLVGIYPKVLTDIINLGVMPIVNRLGS